MKKTFRLLAIAAIFTFAALNTNAQKAVKLGHFNSQEVMQKMPDYEQAQKTLSDYVEELRGDLEAMSKEFDRLSSEYQAKKDQLSDLLRQNKEKEIQDAYNRLQASQADSQQKVAAKESELRENIYNKIKKAAENVAKSNKYDYIFESNGILWYAGDSDDISPLIEKELGIKK